MRLKPLLEHWLRAWLLASAILMLTAGASPAEPSALSQEPIVARIDGEPIYASEVERYLRPAPPRISAAPPVEPRLEALHRALRVRLFTREAARRGLNTAS
jgi:hypothetical protein